MSSTNANQGLRNHARSPSAIVNAQHNDPSGSAKTIAGSSGAMSSVVVDSTVLTPVENFAVIRVANTNAAVQFIWVGLQDAAPGTVNATTGMALPAGSVENFCLPASSDPQKAVCVKTSSSTVQIVIMDT